MVILAVDYGDVRTGLAVCDALEMVAVPLGVITGSDRDLLISEIAGIALRENAGMIVVGLPRNMDGTCGFKAQECTEFAKQLERKVNVPVNMWDERLTTVAANNLLNETGNRGKKRKKIIDAVAAVMILQSYIDYRKNNSGNR